MAAPSVLIVVPSAPDAHAGRARLLLERPESRHCVGGRRAAAIEQHHAREVLIVNATPVVTAVSGGLACHFSISEVALEIAHGAATGAFHAKKPDHASLNLQHRGTFHNRHPANDCPPRPRPCITPCGGQKTPA